MSAFASGWLGTASGVLCSELSRPHPRFLRFAHAPPRIGGRFCGRESGDTLKSLQLTNRAVAYCPVAVVQTIAAVRIMMMMLVPHAMILAS